MLKKYSRLSSAVVVIGSLRVKIFYVMGKALSEELSCTQTDLVMLFNLHSLIFIFRKKKKLIFHILSIRKQDLNMPFIKCHMSSIKHEAFPLNEKMRIK